MIKLKSFFRRGHGQSPSGSKSGSHQRSSSATSKLSSSTSSLNITHPSPSSSISQIKVDNNHDYDNNIHLRTDKEKLDNIPAVVAVAPSTLQRQKKQQQQPLLPPIKPKKKDLLMPTAQSNSVSNNNLNDHRNEHDCQNNCKTSSATGAAAAAIGGSSSFADINAMLEASNMQELQSQLERLTEDKMALEAQVSELSPYNNEVQQLRHELTKLQNIQEMCNVDIQKLTYENETLRNRLRDVVNSPLSDAEKHQLIQDSQRLHSSAPASIALPNINENDGTPCVTPDWDKHSSSSEVSVACLQDKIIQMEETHYSTNEELQATLQELSDLQAQLSEVQSYNERLTEEKDVLFQSLCRQTDKLEDSRSQITTLQELLLRESNQIDVGTTTEREKKLLDLLKNAQDERETLLIKQKELSTDLADVRQTLENSSNENSRVRERISLLDLTVDAANADRKQIELQLAQAKEDSSEKFIEISRLNTILENARAKIDELEQDRAMGDKSDLGELLDSARKEKDFLEAQVASLQEQLSKSQVEIQKLKDQLAVLNEECKVAKNNAKCALSHLEYKYETLKEEKSKLVVEYQQLQETTNELQVQCKCHLEDKSQLESLLSETQRHLGEAERQLAEKEEQVQKEVKLRTQEAEEWQQFQSDLLMTVRVANDFKTEAQLAREQLVMDNKTLRSKIRVLEQQIEKLNKQVSTSDAQQSLLSTVQQEMAARRPKSIVARQDSRHSVKSLIESIESNKPSKTAETASRCSSTSSLNSVATDSNVTQATTTRIAPEWPENVSDDDSTYKRNNSEMVPPLQWHTANNTKSSTREQQQPIQSTVSSSTGTTVNFTMNTVQKTTNASERKDPLNALIKNGGSKRNALLKWCQNKTVGYRNIDITNFSSSWNDGLAFCAILHSYLPDRVPYDTLSTANKRRNFSIAFSAAESVGISTTLNINDMCNQERPDWTQVMAYVTGIYTHFES